MLSMFDDRKLKVRLKGQLWSLEHDEGIVSSCGDSTFSMALENVPLHICREGNNMCCNFSFYI